MFDYNKPFATSGDKNAGTIYWNPAEGIRNYDNKGHDLSPANNLLHEAGHGTDFISDPNRYLQEMSLPAGSYQNLEDKRVMTGIEAEALRMLGLPPRTDHETGQECPAQSLVQGC